uniref:hypothetical protein n=1 Tax=Roseivirga sp. TaxID=1964215 RepID=UPI0040487F27
MKDVVYMKSIFNIMRKLFILLLFFGSMASLKAQFRTLSGQAEVSVITIGPGSELYDSFGHGALRIHDPYLNIDYAYNYGTYESFQDGFYVKFAQGKLLYKLAVQDFRSFFGQLSEPRQMGDGTGFGFDQ